MVDGCLAVPIVWNVIALNWCFDFKIVLWCWAGNVIFRDVADSLLNVMCSWSLGKVPPFSRVKKARWRDGAVTMKQACRWRLEGVNFPTLAKTDCWISNQHLKGDAEDKAGWWWFPLLLVVLLIEKNGYCKTKITSSSRGSFPPCASLCSAMHGGRYV